MDREIKTLNEGMTLVEFHLKLVLKKQTTQAKLPQKLLNTHSRSSSIAFDDNKKGERIGEDRIHR